jgi:excisionase family DNA binding protein
MKKNEGHSAKPHGNVAGPADMPTAVAPLAPMLLSVTEVAHLMGVSRNMIWKLRSVGGIPMPICVGRLTRWRLRDIQAWIEAGCPRSK